MAHTYELTHLKALEAEAIHIIREVAAEFERPGPAVLGRQGLAS
jgi:3'-phosphoadenosine 5'-phosphosulfate sulfotransferase (PAPS reductase)/FAD synthetase